MVVGFNHNVMYKGDVFHIQTEDSGTANPHIITLLYRGGTILASKKTSYADIIKIDKLDQVVEELMKEQHKEMLRNLKSGHFDERAFGTPPAISAEPHGRNRKPEPPPPAAAVKQEKAAAVPSSSRPPAPAAGTRSPQSLDEVILDYLVRGDDT